MVQSLSRPLTGSKLLYINWSALISSQAVRLSDKALCATLRLLYLRGNSSCIFEGHRLTYLLTEMEADALSATCMYIYVCMFADSKNIIMYVEFVMYKWLYGCWWPPLLLLATGNWPERLRDTEKQGESHRSPTGALISLEERLGQQSDYQGQSCSSSRDLAYRSRLGSDC
jgi:hypothetical protein